MIYMYNMQNMQNVHTWTPVAFILLQHRNKVARVLFQPGIGLVSIVNSRCNLQNQIISIPRTRAEKRLRRFQAGGWTPSPGGWSAANCLQFLWCRQPTRNAHLTRMFYMPNQEYCIKANVTPRGVGFLQTQCVQQCPVLYNTPLAEYDEYA